MSRCKKFAKVKEDMIKYKEGNQKFVFDNL